MLNESSSESEPNADDLLVWKALADPTRRSILDLLRHDAMTTGALVEHFAMSRYGVMKHLGVLHDAGLILIRRRGRERFNHLNTVPIRQIYRRWMQPFAESSADGLLRLKALAEQGESTMTESQAPRHDGFHTLDIQQEIQIAASPARVWQSLTTEAIGWWPKDFYIGGTPRGFVVEPKVGGRVYEDWGDGQGGLWGTITLYEHERMLQWVGDLGPNFGGPARTIATFKLVPDGDGTRLEFRDASFGALSEGARSSIDSGWAFLLGDCLKPYAENGRQPERPDSVVAAEASAD